MARTKNMVTSRVVPGGTTVEKPRRPHRYRPGTVALREIRRYQRSTNLLTSKAGIEAYVRNIPAVHEKQLQFQSKAFEALREASEAYISDLFRRSMIVATSRGSVTLHSRDLKTALAVLNGVGPNV